MTDVFTAAPASLPSGANIAATELDRIQKALDEIMKDPHAPRSLTVNVTLHVYNEYPKHLTVTKVVNNADEEAAFLAGEDAPPTAPVVVTPSPTPMQMPSKPALVTPAP